MDDNGWLSDQWWGIIDHPETDPHGCRKMFMALPENVGTTWWMSGAGAMEEWWVSDEWVMSDSGCAKLKHKNAEQAQEKKIGNYNNTKRT